jgi:hypothetical protein
MQKTLTFHLNVYGYVLFIYALFSPFDFFPIIINANVADKIVNFLCLQYIDLLLLLYFCDSKQSLMFFGGRLPCT